MRYLLACLVMALMLGCGSSSTPVMPENPSKGPPGGGFSKQGPDSGGGGESGVPSQSL